MVEQLSILCANCGTSMDLPEGASDAVICPVCQFVNELGAAPQLASFTPDALEAQLGSLIDQARTSGLELDEIVRVLRDELEFTAELASSGRNLSVQIIDLGPLETQLPQRLMRDRSIVLRGRVVGR